MLVPLVVGTIELLQVASAKLGLDTGFWAWLNGLDFGEARLPRRGPFVLTWAVSVLIWKNRRIEERWSAYVVE